ncbi:MAG: hypothetical protein M9962_08550 [Oligoflexia bacterium]|nr:hypothetical protein [Oligoflexia bacterium]
MILSIIITTIFYTVAEASYCKTLSAIQNNLMACEDNIQFSKEAEDCVRRFSSKVKREQQALQKLLLGVVNESGSNQDLAQNNSQAASENVYKNTISKLDSLIKEAEERKTEVEIYRRNLVWPIIWNSEMGPLPDVDEPELQALFDEDYCYGEYSDHLKDAKQDFDTMIKDLTAAREIAKMAENSSTDRKKLLDNPVFKSSKPLLSESEAKGNSADQLPADKRQSQENTSDITGTEDVEE